MDLHNSTGIGQEAYFNDEVTQLLVKYYANI